MIFRYPVIVVLALVVVMAAVPLSTGRLIGNANNSDTKVHQQLDAAQEELQKVNSDIYHLEVAHEELQKAEAEIIRNLRKARVHHEYEIERTQLMLSKLEGSQQQQQQQYSTTSKQMKENNNTQQQELPQNMLIPLLQNINSKGSSRNLSRMYYSHVNQL